MKKRIFGLLLIILLFLIGCQVPEEEVPKEEPKTLSELQIEACNSADQAGNCDTRLAEVGIVLKEDCCEVLGKCC